MNDGGAGEWGDRSSLGGFPRSLMAKKKLQRPDLISFFCARASSFKTNSPSEQQKHLVLTKTPSFFCVNDPGPKGEKKNGLFRNTLPMGRTGRSLSGALRLFPSIAAFYRHRLGGVSNRRKENPFHEDDNNLLVSLASRRQTATKTRREYAKRVPPPLPARSKIRRAKGSTFRGRRRRRRGFPQGFVAASGFFSGIYYYLQGMNRMNDMAGEEWRVSRATQNREEEREVS